MSHRRLFVALRLPESVCDALLDTMEGVAGARWQDADNLHITLRFVGEIDRHQADDVISALECVPMRPFPLAIDGVGHFDGAKRAKAILASCSLQMITLSNFNLKVLAPPTSKPWLGSITRSLA